MPCSDGGYENTRTIEVEAGHQTARLCAVFKVLEAEGTLQGVLDRADWREAGVSQGATESWWLRHKANDRMRKARERQRALEKKQRDDLLAALGPEKRKILGL